MGLKLVLLLSQLAFLLVISSSLPVPLPPPPTQSPSYPLPTYPPTKPPTKPPTLPPVKPPTKPPTLPPLKPPTLPPVKPPTKPPTYPPVKPPTKPPVKPAPTPYYPPNFTVAIQGVVFCKNCTYFGVNTLLGAKPLANATVALKCKNMPTKIMATTDKNGYFFLQAPKKVGQVIRWCKVYLVAPPPGSPCKHASNLNGGFHGGYLKPEMAKKGSPYALYTVGPFAFEPPKRACRKY